VSDDADDAKRARIIAARLKLRDRFLADAARTPSMADERPMGSGPPNRHGMPRLPPNQYETKKWPVLDLGAQPRVTRDRWRLTVDGACARPIALDWAAFAALDQIDDVSDFHCVTAWSRLDVPWRGVRLSDVLALAEPHDGAAYLMCHAYDGYTTNLSLAEAVKPDVLLVHSSDGGPLPADHGGPVRVITPQLYAWKGAKWIQRLELMIDDRPGFWEERGYSMTAYPWRDDRYS
jgi:DMSO/TMAO reductase YedYZ molybdopterin-dependent catalytic subunit